MQKKRKKPIVAHRPPADPRAGLSGMYRNYLASLVLFHLAAADAVGLSGSDYQADSILELHGPLTSGELARRLGLSTGATTRLIDRLEAAGHARRVTDPADRRRVLVAHSGSVPAELTRILATVREPIGELVASFSPEQLDALRRYFDGAGSAYQAALEQIRRGGGRSMARAARPRQTKR